MFMDHVAKKAVPLAPVRVSSQCAHAPRSCQSHLPTNDKGDNEMILGAVDRCPHICLTAEENPGKPQRGDRR